MKLRFNLRYFALLLPFVHVSRGGMNHMLLEPLPSGGGMLIATDGATMGVFYDRHAIAPKSGVCLSVQNLPFKPKLIEEALKPVHGLLDNCNHKYAVVDNAPKIISKSSRESYFHISVKSTETHWGFKVCRKTADFPDWKSVIPALSGLSNGSNANYNPMLLARFSLGWEKHQYGCSIRLCRHPLSEATVILHSQEPDFFGMLMPKEGPSILPAANWMYDKKIINLNL